MAVQCAVNMLVFVPPKDAVRPATNFFYRCIQLLGAAAQRQPPTLHLTIANGHFTALTNPARKFVKADKQFTVCDMAKEGHDPATGG